MKAELDEKMNKASARHDATLEAKAKEAAEEVARAKELAAEKKAHPSEEKKEAC
jgi:hypothetical protein